MVKLVQKLKESLIFFLANSSLFQVSGDSFNGGRRSPATSSYEFSSKVTPFRCKHLKFIITKALWWLQHDSKIRFIDHIQDLNFLSIQSRIRWITLLSLKPIVNCSNPVWPIQLILTEIFTVVSTFMAAMFDSWDWFDHSYSTDAFELRNLDTSKRENNIPAIVSLFHPKPLRCLDKQRLPSWSAVKKESDIESKTFDVTLWYTSREFKLLLASANLRIRLSMNWGGAQFMPTA